MSIAHFFYLALPIFKIEGYSVGANLVHAKQFNYINRIQFLNLVHIVCKMPRDNLWLWPES